MRFSGFPPFYDKESKILILGSFPSVKSREVQFFYGNPQNRFWKVLAKAFSDNIPVTTDEKKAFLSRHHIALWDMVTECEIEGSLDNTIKNYEVADLSVVLNNASIERIICNGGKSKEVFLKNYKNLSNIATFLPSTSPLNTRFDESIWIDALK